MIHHETEENPFVDDFFVTHIAQSLLMRCDVIDPILIDDVIWIEIEPIDDIIVVLIESFSLSCDVTRDQER